ncbi:hypothetical protein Taro_017325 [Colocasia esculenta]|uniref:Transmembrane protein n=1 Tax=Colocasia esculenta TaxID=4460 RepID=A0A843USV7_COLES|nr:hypothetical protein [Colocasia esculenta]
MFPSVIRCPSLYGGYSLVVPSSRGRHWSSLVRTCASGGFRSVFSRFRSPVLGCQFVVAPASVVSQPGGVSRVQGGSACGPSTLWRSEVAVLEDCSILISVCCCATSGSEVCCCFGWCVLAGFPRLVPWWFWWRFSQDRLTLLLLAAVFSLMVRVVWSFRFFRESSFVASGGGSSQECSVFVSGHRCVAPVVRSVPFGRAVFWRGSPKTALGTLGWRFSPELLRVVLVVAALSICRDELLLLPVELSVLHSCCSSR